MKDEMLKTGKSFYFNMSTDGRSGKRNFIAYNGERLLIAKNPKKRDGYFAIKRTILEKEKYSLVQLGLRQMPKDIYPYISLDELIKVLNDFKFMYYISGRHLFAFHCMKHIWINATMNEDEDKTFKSIIVIFPNVLENFSWRNKFGRCIHSMNIKTVTMDLCRQVTDNPLDRLFKLILYADDKKIFTKIDGELLISEAFDSNRALYESLPDNFKEFIEKNSENLVKEGQCSG